jgi:hypothetical protein
VAVSACFARGRIYRAQFLAGREFQRHFGMAGNGQVNATLAAVYGFSNALEVLVWFRTSPD